jgi:hypothetical protein
MVAEIFAGLGAIKSAFDLAKGLKDISDAALRNSAIIELQEKILAAQQEQSALIETVCDLEKEVASLKDWEADKKRYELTEISPWIFAFSIKDAMRRGEPFHRICANCCANGKKSYLQQHVNNSALQRFGCNLCGEQLKIYKTDNRPSPPSSRGGGPNSWLGR